MSVRPVHGSPEASPAAIWFRVSDDHSIVLGREGLDELCAAAARAMREGAGTTIRVVLEEHESVTAAIARLKSDLPEADRQWSPNDLAPQLERLEAETKHLETGIRLLFSPDLGPLGFPDGLGADQLAIALQAFVRYEWEGTSERWKPTLQLDLYPRDRPRLSARVRLDVDETVAFLERQSLPPDANPWHLKSLDLGFRDLGPELALKRALPAVLSNVAFHAISRERMGLTFDLADLPPVVGWSMGLA